MNQERLTLQRVTEDELRLSGLIEGDLNPNALNTAGLIAREYELGSVAVTHLIGDEIKRVPSTHFVQNPGL